MGRRPTNNPRQIPSKACGCPACTTKYRPGAKPTSRDCIGSWQYRYTAPDGRPRALNRDTYDAAVADGEKAKVEIRQGTWIDPKRADLTLEQWWTKWRPNLNGGATHHITMESFWKNHVHPAFGRYPLPAIGYLEIQTWVTALSKQAGLGPASVRKAFMVLNTLLKAALRDRRIPFNPAEGVKLPAPRRKSPEDKRPPTYAQLWLIRQKLPTHHHALQILAQETGLRWGELTDLRACWVDLDKRVIHVREVFTREHWDVVRKEYPKSEAGYRTVPLTGLAYRVLQDHLAERQPSWTKSSPEDGMHPEELVFIARTRKWKGQPVTLPLKEYVFNKAWQRACEAAGVQRVRVRKLSGGRTRRECWPTWHDQRHTFASRLHERGVPEAVVQEILGHERGGAVTWLYTHAGKDPAGQLAAAMADWKARGSRRLRLVG